MPSKTHTTLLRSLCWAVVGLVLLVSCRGSKESQSSSASTRQIDSSETHVSTRDSASTRDSSYTEEIVFIPVSDSTRGEEIKRNAILPPGVDSSDFRGGGFYYRRVVTTSNTATNKAENVDKVASSTSKKTADESFEKTVTKGDTLSSIKGILIALIVLVGLGILAYLIIKFL